MQGRARGLATLAVSALLLATLVATWLTQRQIDTRQEAALDYEATRIDDAIAERMHAYVQVLLGGAGLFDASSDVSRDEWVAYVDTLRVDERYPGFKSLTFAQAVPDEELAAFEERQRQLLPGYTVRPPVAGVTTNPSLHSPIVFVAPSIPENTRVLGVDMMEEPSRRAAMERAAATGEAVLSPLLNLAGQGDETAGFIAYLAVRDDGRLLGWLTAAFLAPDFFRGLLGTAPPHVEFEITDGHGAVLYSTEPLRSDGSPVPLPGSDQVRSTSVELPGRTWEMRYRSAAGFESSSDQVLPWLVLASGLLLTLLIGTLLTASARASATARHQATHDPLTSLANRALFDERVSAAIRNQAPFAVAYIDIDRFKPVNDNLGHATGDELLVAVAARIRARARGRSGDTVARMGGDEFAVVLTNPERADEFAAEVAARIADPFSLTTGTVAITASVGVARFPEDGTTAAALLAASDRAMYAAKQQPVSSHSD